MSWHFVRRLIIIISRSDLKLRHVGSKTRLLGQQATQVSDLGPLWPSCFRGWSGGAMVLGKLPVPGRPTIWITVGQGPTALAVGAGGGCLDIFTLIYPFSPLSPSFRETEIMSQRAYNPNTTNQPTNPFLPLEPFGGIPQKVSKLLPISMPVIIDVYSFVVDRRMRRINLARCV